MTSFPWSEFCSALLVTVLLLSPGPSYAAERPSPEELLRRVQTVYAAMKSYTSVGEVSSTISPSGLGPQQTTYAFTVMLSRPQLYRIEWEQRMPNLSMKGAVWSAGEGDFVAIPGQSKPERAKDTSTAIAMATGISGGAANTIPSMFFGLNGSALKLLTDPTFAPDEPVEGDLCFVLKGRVGKQAKTLWISQKSLLLRRVRQEFDGPMEVPPVTDADVRETLKAMNRETSDASVAAMKAQLERAHKMMGDGLTGSIVEVHKDIKVDLAVSARDCIPTTVLQDH